MNKVYDIIEQLENTSGTLDKLSILKKNKDYKLLVNVITLTLNPFINFYIKKIPEHEPSGQKNLQWALDQLEKLYRRELTGHAGRDHLQFILNSVDINDADIICRIIKRDLKCGVGVGSVNKVWDDLIADLPMMLAQPMKEKFIKRIKYPAYAQLKSDGARCVAIVTNGEVQLLSRNCLEYNGLQNLAKRILDFVGKEDNVVFDGELLVLNKDGTLVSRKTGNGIVNKSTQGTISEDEADQIIYTVWDCIPYNDYFSSDGICQTPYQTRYGTLLGMKKNSRVMPIENKLVNNLNEAKDVFLKYVEQGLEGIILKNIDSPWQDKRSNNQVKFKVEIHSDLICIGVYEGEKGKQFEGSLGGITLKTKDDLLQVDCGSGFKPEERDYFWKHPEEIIGKVVEVKHNGIIDSNSKDTLSVFLPIYQFIRTDKNIEDADTVDSIDSPLESLNG